MTARRHVTRVPRHGAGAQHSAVTGAPFATAALVVALAVALVAPAVRAQQPAPMPEPVVGQPGKDVIWVPTPLDLLEKMLDLARVTPRDLVMDLGSGDGRAVIAAARRGARAIGVEYDAPLVAVSRKAAAAAGVSGRATFVQGDMYAADIRKATALVLFLLPKNLATLRATFQNLAPGTRIVNNTFTIPDWPFDEETEISTCDPWCTARLWIVPAKAAGAWRMGRGVLDLTQKYQSVTGTLTEGDQRVPVTGSLRGDAIALQAGSATYTGHVHGSRIAGTRTEGGHATPWTARR